VRVIVSPAFEHQIASDPEQKRAQSAAIRVVRVGLAPQRQEAFLDDVLGAIRRSGHPIDEPVEDVLVGVERVPEVRSGHAGQKLSHKWRPQSDSLRSLIGQHWATTRE
jgi:hypothetical protein